MSNFLAFIIGLLVGTFIGFVTAALMVAARRTP
jgi:gas vesicle protein